MSQVVDYANTILQADAVVLYLYDRECDAVVLPPAMKGVRHPEMLMPSAFSGDSALIRIIRSGRSRYAQDSEKDSILSGVPRPLDAPQPFIHREGIVSSAGVLLKVMGEIVGVLLVNYRDHHDFGKAEREEIELFASQAAVAIQNALRLEQQRDLTKQADVLRGQAEALKNISEGLNTALTPHDVAENVLDGLKQVYLLNNPGEPIMSGPKMRPVTVRRRVA